MHHCIAGGARQPLRASVALSSQPMSYPANRCPIQPTGALSSQPNNPSREGGDGRRGWRPPLTQDAGSMCTTAHTLRSQRDAPCTLHPAPCILHPGFTSNNPNLEGSDGRMGWHPPLTRDAGSMCTTVLRVDEQDQSGDTDDPPRAVIIYFSGRDYRGTSLIRKRTPLGPYRRPMPRVLGWS